MRTANSFLPCLLLVLSGSCAAQSGILSSKVSGTDIGQSIEGLLVDYSAASVSAASLAVVGTDAVTVVENVRDFSVLLKSADKKTPTFGISVTPARTSFAFPRIGLSEYANHLGQRLLGSLTFGYAQGKSDTAGQDFDRRAISVETSAFFRPEDDPVVAVASADCAKQALDVFNTGEPAPAPTPVGPATIKVGSKQQLQRALEAYDDCASPKLEAAEKKWNRSRFSVSLATGWIKRSDGSADQVSLGQTLAVGLVYGFDKVEFWGLEDRAALTMLVRKSRHEPVLLTLVNSPVAFKDTTLVAARLSGGSPIFRALMELSNARDRDLTTSQTAFTRALGIDYRVMDVLWLGLRMGRQRKADGTGNEVGSFATLNYSPSARLGR